MNHHLPAVLCFSGHDPSGGAGIQADIETLISHQCHPCSVITALTDQDTHNVKCLTPVGSNNIFTQAMTIAQDISITACKIGLLGFSENVSAIQRFLTHHEHLPVVLDPVLAAGGGTELASDELIKHICEHLLPLTTLITPNSEEARRISGYSNLNDCAQYFLDQGCQNVIITGTHENSTHVHNHFYQQDGFNESFTFQRLQGEYHGSGCTLASASAALLAHGLDPFTAVNEAQEYTWNALESAYQTGGGQLNPNRFFWIENR